jgi:Trk-type K+ transport system membrane component
MAAVFALILLPAIAAVGFMVLNNGIGSFAAVMATMCFAMLAGGIFFGLLNLSRQWENEQPTGS